MKLETPRDLFVHEMSAMRTGEAVIADMLDEMSGMVADENVADMLRHHQQETQQQIANLEQCFRAIGATPQRVPCAAIEALRQEFREFAGMNGKLERFTHEMGRRMLATV